MSRKAEAIVNVIEAYNTRKAAYDSCEVDPSYFCWREDEAYKKACEELEEAFSNENPPTN